MGPEYTGKLGTWRISVNNTVVSGFVIWRKVFRKVFITIRKFTLPAINAPPPPKKKKTNKKQQRTKQKTSKKKKKK